MRKKNSSSDLPDVSDETGKSTGSGANGFNFDKLLVIRLVLASVLFAAALAVKLPALLATLFLILSIVFAGYDLVIQAVNDVSAKHYFSASLAVIFAAVVSFAIGFGQEGTALVILYRIGLLLVDYTKARTVSSAIDFIPEDQDSVITHAALLFSNSETGKTDIWRRAERIMGIFSKILAAAALVYAIVLPIVSDFTYAVSIHRALTLLIIAVPVSVFASLPLCDIVGLGYSAASGVVFNSSSAFDAADKINAAVFDKSGVFSDGKPKLASIKSAKLDTETFIKMAAHIGYYSSLPAIRAIAGEYNGPIMQEILTDHSEIPGCGSEIRIKGVSMCLGTKDMMALKGVRVPAEDIRAEGTVLYMSVAGRYAGCVTLTEGVNPDSAAIISELREAGVNNFTLLTEVSSENSAAFASSIDVSEYYAQCSLDDKLAAVSQCRDNNEDGGALLFVCSERLDYHSAADLDACVGTSDPNADIFLTKGGVREIPLAKAVSARSKTVQTENVLLVFIVKVLLIALTLTGFCNLWFAVFLCFAAELGAILNAIRVSMPPLHIFSGKKRTAEFE